MPARILVIEDNRENLELMVYLLTAFGHTVLKAMDGEEGLKLAAHERPDLILCDLQMPKADGFEVARQIRRDPQLAHLPLVAVTAYAMRGDHDKVMASGFSGYITKPIVPEEFVSRTEEFLKAELHSATQLPASAPQGPAPTLRRDANRATILALDDLKVNLSLIRSTLEPLGYKVIAVETVNDALKMARQDHPDLILSDVHLPEVGGYEFLVAVKRDPSLKTIPFILMSSTVATESALSDGYELGATRVLFRPLEPEVLVREVETCLADRNED